MAIYHRSCAARVADARRRRRRATRFVRGRVSPGRRSCSARSGCCAHRLWLGARRLGRRRPRSSSSLVALRRLAPAPRRRARAARPRCSSALEGRRLRRWTLRAARLPLADIVDAAQSRRGRAGVLLAARARRRRAAPSRRAPRPRRRARPRRDRPVPGAARPMSVAIIDYGSGNLHSAAKAFERAAREAGLDARRSRSRPIPTRCARPTASCCRASAPSPIAGAASTPCRAWSRR